MSVAETNPADDAIRNLRPSDLIGLGYVLLAVSLTAVGICFSFLPPMSALPAWALWPIRIASQLVLALGLVQWFVLLHECGHGILFRSRRWNRLAGQVAGFFSFIPFDTWTLVHNQHHRWTGWQDLDPTTATLVPRPLSARERALMNACWRWWIPLFVLLYRVNNFWNLPRLWKLFPGSAHRWRMCLGACTVALAIASLVWWVGPGELALRTGLGIWLSMVFLDSLILSQHTHVPMTLSEGATVKPYPAPAQAAFTRSLSFPRPISTFLLLNVGAHELHHVYPTVPGYRLGRIDYRPANEFNAWRWIHAARGLSADVFLFQNRDGSGSSL